MKIIEVVKGKRFVRFWFESDDGLHSWMVIDHSGVWLDGTFKQGSAPYHEQIEKVEHYYSTTNDDNE